MDTSFSDVFDALFPFARQENPGSGVKRADPTGSDVAIIGRGDDVDLRIEHPDLSPRHAQLTRHPDGSFTLRDLGSAAGTFVNGRRLAEGSVDLQPGDEVRFGTMGGVVGPTATNTTDPVQLGAQPGLVTVGPAAGPVPVTNPVDVLHHALPPLQRLPGEVPRQRLVLFVTDRRTGAPCMQVPVYAALEETTSPFLDGDGRTEVYPLGALASDHAGYASYDMARLHSTLRARVDAGPTTTTVPSGVKGFAASLDDAGSRDQHLWVYLWADKATAVDALVDGECSPDVIVLRLTVDGDQPHPIRGLPAIQTAGVVDWKLSPGSFTRRTSGLLGAGDPDDGCGQLLPSTLGTSTFRFYEILRGPVLSEIEPSKFSHVAGLRSGQILQYETTFTPIGHALGELQYSLALAPAESVNLAVVEWSRTDTGSSTQDTTVTEQLVHDQTRDRTINEVVDATVNEWQHGGSVEAGAAASLHPANLFGLSLGIGGGYSTSSGTRTVSANTTQQIADAIHQNTTDTRDLHSTVVVQTTAAAKDVIETRNVTNYNHAHTLTVLYFEVLRHYYVRTALVRTRPALLVRTSGTADDAQIDRGPIPVTFTFDNLRRYLPKLTPHLLDPSLTAATEIVEKAPVWPIEDDPDTLLVDMTLEIVMSVPDSGPPNSFSVPAPVYAYFQPRGTTDWKHETGKTRRVLPDVVVEDNGPDHNVPLFGPGYGGPQVPYGNPAGIWHVRCETETDPNAHHSGPVNWHDLGALLLNTPPPGCLLDLATVRLTAYTGTGRSVILLDEFVNAAIDEGTDHGWVGILRPPPASGLTTAQRHAVSALVTHLNDNASYYKRLLILAEDPEERATRFDAQALHDGTNLLDAVENRVMEVQGGWAAFAATDLGADKLGLDSSDPVGSQLHLQLTADAQESLVALPARGVFAEAQLGHCSVAEPIDDTRFWDWQASPIPNKAPDVSPVQTDPLPQPAQPSAAAAPNAVLNVVNAPSEPNPAASAKR